MLIIHVVNQMILVVNVVMMVLTIVQIVKKKLEFINLQIVKFEYYEIIFFYHLLYILSKANSNMIKSLTKMPHFRNYPNPCPVSGASLVAQW